MKEIDEIDKNLIKRASEIIHDRCDDDYHTVGCALITSNDNIYLGLNMDGIHSICAEQTAISNAYIAGDTDIKRIVSVGLFKGQENILAPCGTCRQFMANYARNVEVIVAPDNKYARYTLDELIPFVYTRHVDENGK